MNPTGIRAIPTRGLRLCLAACCLLHVAWLGSCSQYVDPNVPEPILPIVEPSNKLDAPKPGTPEHAAWSKVHRAQPGPDREEIRSQTLRGVADALAAVWVPFVREAINRRSAA